MARKNFAGQSFACAVFLMAAAGLNASAQATRNLISQPVNETQLVTVAGNTHAAARAEHDQGMVDDSTPLEHVIMLLKRTPEQQQNLAALIDQLHNPKSPSYHQWLTPEQFGKQFGPSESDLTTLTAWMESHGLTVEEVAPGQNLLIFSGSSGQVREAFHTELHHYLVNGEKHYANASEPQVPAALAPLIAGFRSLNDFRLRPLKHDAGVAKHNMKTGEWEKVSGPLSAPELTFTYGGRQDFFVSPQDFYTIYNENPLFSAAPKIDGHGVTIAVIEETNVAHTSDVTSFRQQFGLPAYPATPNSTDGGVNWIIGPGHGCNTVGVTSTGEEGEALLDVEWAGAVAPKAIVDFVACGGSNGIDLAAQYVTNYLPSTVVATSLSYGECEYDGGSSGAAFYRTEWEQEAAEGITPVVSSGDSGSLGCDQNAATGTHNLYVNEMADTPYNISAGGTDFSDFYQAGNYSTYWSTTNSTVPNGSSALSYIPEITWGSLCANTLFVSYLQSLGNTTYGSTYTPEAVCNSTNAGPTHNDLVAPIGGGGGVSTYNSLPSWQSAYGVGLAGNQTSTTLRNQPDVSFFASNGWWGHALVYCQSDTGFSCDYSATGNDANAYNMAAGGTSFVAPQINGMMALIVQMSGERQGVANYTLYNLGTLEYGSSTTPNSANLATCSGSGQPGTSVGANCIFHDIAGDTPNPWQGGTLTSDIIQPCVWSSVQNCYRSSSTDRYGLTSVGNHPGTNSPAYPASQGYDAATGLGSPNITNLVNNWNTATPLFASATTVSADPTSIPASANTTLTATVSASGRGETSTTGPPAVGTVNFYIGSTSGTLLGTGTLTQTCTGTAPSNLVCPPSTATLSVPGTSLAVGANSLIAYFPGDAANDAPSTSSAVNVTVQAPASPIASVSPPGLTFGNQILGTTSGSQPVTLSNTGTAALTITGIAASANFGQTNNCGGSLAASSSCTINVTFSPTAPGALTGTLTITDDSNGVAGSIQTVSLTGTAIVLPPVAVPGTLKTASSSPASITLSATDAYGYALTFSIVTGPANGTLSAVTPLNSTSAVVTYTPNAGFAGSDSFVYAATDPLANSGSATVNITVTGNPVPEISQPVAPDAVAPGAAGFSLSINGAGFEPGAVANWQQGSVTTPLATTMVSPTQVTATVPASLVATAGTAWLTVNNPPPGGGASNTVFFPITSPTSSVSLAIASQVATGNYPDFVVVGDFNGDGKLDLAVANASDNTVSILLGDGSGNFTLKATLPTGVSPSCLAVADLNGDGRPDLAIISGSGSTLTVLLGNGDGTFSSPSFSMPFASSALFMVAGDFNGDGKMDLAVSTYPQTVLILLGNGDGTFTLSSSATTGDDPCSLAVGDFNGDGKLDLAVVNALSNIVTVLLGNGDGTFTLSRPFPATAVEPASVAVGDFNGDGKLDLAVSGGAGSGVVSIFLGNGDGTFQPANSFAAGVYPQSVAVADFNGDGKPDLAVVNGTGTPGVSILDGNGDGTFQAPVSYIPGAVLSSLAVGDFNADGRMDLAVTNIGGNTVSILLQAPAVTPSPASLSFNSQALGVTSAAQTITLTNTGSALLTLNSVSLNGTNAGDFAKSADNCTGATVAPNGTCTVSVTFTPTVIGVESATLSVNDNAAGSPQTVTLSGTGTGPAVSLSASSLTFANQPKGTTSTAQTETVTNTGTANLAITTVALGGANASDFAKSSDTCTGATLSPNGTCTVSVIFTPTAVGTRSAWLFFTDNAVDSPQTINLSGSGTAPVLVSLAVTPANASLSAGATQQFTATGTYSDGSTQNLTSSVAWTSSTPAVATITSGGLATAVAAGSTTIQATSGGISGSTGLTVTAGGGGGSSGPISLVDNDANHGHLYCGHGSSNCNTAVIDTTGATLYTAIISTHAAAGTIQTLVGPNTTNNQTSLDVWTCPAAASVHDSGGNYLQGCYAVAPTPNTNVVFHCLGGSGNYVNCLVAIWKGTDVTSAVLTASNGAASSGNVGSISPGSVATAAGYLTVTGWGSNGTNYSFGSTPTGYTVMDNQTNTSGELGAHAYLINGSNPQNPSWQLTSGTEDMTSVIMVFRPVTGTPITVYNFTSGYSTHMESSTPLGVFAVAAGNWVVCGVSDWSSFGTSHPTGITDNASTPNVFTDLGLHSTYNDGSHNWMGSIWVANITTANSSDVITVSYADSTYKGNIICHQYTNLDLTNPVDAGSEVQATTTTGSATSMTSPSFNTASANEVIFVFGVTAVVAVQTFTPGTNYTLRGLDYNADGPPPNDIEQQAAVEDWQPGVTETGTTASISWTNASDAQILVVGLKGLTGTTSATTRRVVNLQ